MLFQRRKVTTDASNALSGRAEPVLKGGRHAVNGRPLLPPYPEHLERAIVGLGCFWGAERLFWKLSDGIWITAVGYAGGFTPNPTYEEVCTGKTGHAEAVLAVFDPKVITYEAILKAFWEAHDPTQGNRQGNDIGTQYRSVVYTTTPEQQVAALASRAAYEKAIAAKGYGPITTEVKPAPEFYFAEEYHQQYLAKNPGGYCGLAGTGVACALPATSGAVT
jgi:peptide-methionine (S)-S-oxide reductase